VFDHETHVRWRANAPEPLASVVGKRIDAVQVARRQVNWDRREHTDAVATEWVLDGLVLSCDGIAIHLFNAMDANGVASTVPVGADDTRVESI
jgi:hypothetical protein